MLGSEPPSYSLGPLAWNALPTSVNSLSGTVKAPNLVSLTLQPKPWLCFSTFTSLKEVVMPYVNICLQMFAGRNVAQCLAVCAVESGEISWV